MPQRDKLITPFAARLKDLRQKSHKTQREMAVELNLDRSTYAYYETDTTKPDFTTLVRIAKIFDVSVDYLVGASDSHVSLSASDCDSMNPLPESRSVCVYDPGAPAHASQVRIPGTQSLSMEEQAHLLLFRQLNAQQRERLLEFMVNTLQVRYSEAAMSQIKNNSKK